MKECPQCKLINPDTAQQCDCGYNFEKKNLMVLEPAFGLEKVNVSEQELADTFQHDVDFGEFIILSQDQDFIQAAVKGDGEDSYVMEYREGDSDHHYQCIKELSREDVQSAFTKYLKRDMSWKTDYDWKLLELKPWWKFW